MQIEFTRLAQQQARLLIYIYINGESTHGTQAMRLYIDHLFNQLNLHRVSLLVYETNPAGIRCYEKVGFKHEGTLREAIFKHGHYINVHMMSILSTEWKNNKGETE